MSSDDGSNMRYVAHEQGEPRGDAFDEPRPADHLCLHSSGEYWIRGEGYETETDLSNPHVGEKVCGSKLRKKWHDSYKRCANFRVEENGRCNIHGGKSLKGSANGNFKHGLYSEALDGKMLARYIETKEHEENAQLGAEITLMTMRIKEHWEMMQQDGGLDIFDDLQSELQSFREAETEDERQFAFSNMTRLIDRGQERAAQWEALGPMVDDKRKLVRDEARRMKESEEVLKPHEAQVLFQQMITHARTVFDAYDVPLQAQADFVALLTGQGETADSGQLASSGAGH